MKLVEQQNFKHKVFGISLADLEPLGLSVLWLARKATISLTDIKAFRLSVLWLASEHTRNDFKVDKTQSC